MNNQGNIWSIFVDSENPKEFVPVRMIEELSSSKNDFQDDKIGISKSDLLAAINRQVDLLPIALHQFQIANYFDPKEHDGILGTSTLDTLGFKDHKLRPKLNSSNFYGQQQLNGIKSKVAQATNNEFTAANWFQYIVRPAFLGHNIKDGIHLLLWRKLKQAEAWLLSQPQYQGMTPVALGRALGLDRPGVRYSGARLSAEKQAMHGFGLAIDIDPVGNPWIGAGWIQYDKEKLKERTRMLQTLKKATGEALKGQTIFEYLDSIALEAGQDTRAAYRILARRNQEFIEYLQNNPAELRYWKNSASFSGRDPLKGFLNLHPDLVYALREVAGLAWGAIDFGPRACGDIMHFDLRTLGVGKVIATHINGYIPVYGHPSLTKSESEFDLEYDEYAEHYAEELEVHEAIEEAEWEDNYLEPDEEHEWHDNPPDPETE
ncbi:MAG: hypothetical protein SFV52_13325 [Saprospiraceae bacterium]|nr:hypothetical protein [Saprospiraceae bacterium]